jgi:hypothetical protein
VRDKQLMQFSQRRYRDPRHPQFHPGTSRGVEHPCRYDQDVAGSHFDMNNFTDRAPLDILSSNPPPIQRVPAVMDLNFLPDMGRMTARLRLAARIICLPAPMPAAAVPLRSTH